MSKSSTSRLLFSLGLCLLGLSIMALPQQRASAHVTSLDEELQAALRQAGFTGRIESTLEQRLGRRLDSQLADLGRNLWFDTLTGLNDDNACRLSLAHRRFWGHAVHRDRY